MDTATLARIIEELRQELRRLDYFISLLEGLAVGKKRRGRPPKFGIDKPARKGGSKK